jgi:hypothetical protein
MYQLTMTCDVVFIGGGFRTTTFLASNPNLFSKKLCIIEQTNTLGAGSFSHFNITSSSNGSSFFRYVDPLGEFGWIYSDPIISKVANTKAPVSLDLLSQALTELGKKIGIKIGNESIFLGRKVEYVDVDPDLDYPIKIELDSGERICAKICVLGTGRSETIHPSLIDYRSKVWLSSNFLSSNLQNVLSKQLYELSFGRILILGCSHSAFSVLQHILNLIKRIQQSHPSYGHPSISIFHRRAVRLYYSSVRSAQEEQVIGREELMSFLRDVCPDTGIVFRDTGLRHVSKSLYCSVWKGQFSHVTMKRIEDLNNCKKMFDKADMIIQALGYRPRTPEIRVFEKCFRLATAETPLNAGCDGFIALPGVSNRRHIAAIRVDPTPRFLQDNGTYAKNLYHLLGKMILFHLHRSVDFTE